jgi:hypothetical protein
VRGGGVRWRREKGKPGVKEGMGRGPGTQHSSAHPGTPSARQFPARCHRSSHRLRLRSPALLLVALLSFLRRYPQTSTGSLKNKVRLSLFLSLSLPTFKVRISQSVLDLDLILLLDPNGLFPPQSFLFLNAHSFSTYGWPLAA